MNTTPDRAVERRSRRSLGAVLAALGVSLTGTRISAIALPWFVLVTSGSATRTGLVAFCEMTPYVLVKAFTGPLIDRVGPRVVSWCTDSASAIAAGLVPLLYAAHLLSFGLLLALVALVGAVRGPGDLAKHVMVPEAAERSGVPMERATGLAGVTERLAGTIAPAAGGSLVAVAGPMAGLVVNAVSFALGSAIIALALPRGMGTGAPTGTVGTDGTDEQGGYWRRFGEGFAFLRADRLLLAITLMIGITNLLDAAYSSVLLPVWARTFGHGPGMIGLVGSAWGISAVCGSLVAAAVAHRLRRRLVFFLGFLIGGAPKFLVLAADAPLWTVLVVFAAGGFGSGFLNPIIGAVVYERIPRRLLGRVGALGDSVAWAGIPLGGLLAGVVVAWAGLVPALVAVAAGYFVTTTVTGLRREWREMDRQRGQDPAVADLAAEPVPLGS